MFIVRMKDQILKLKIKWTIHYLLLYKDNYTLTQEISLFYNKTSLLSYLLSQNLISQLWVIMFIFKGQSYYLVTKSEVNVTGVWNWGTFPVLSYNFHKIIGRV